jgi:hypothetical protein
VISFRFPLIESDVTEQEKRRKQKSKINCRNSRSCKDCKQGCQVAYLSAILADSGLMEELLAETKNTI